MGAGAGIEGGIRPRPGRAFLSPAGVLHEGQRSLVGVPHPAAEPALPAALTRGLSLRRKGEGKGPLAVVSPGDPPALALSQARKGWGTPSALCTSLWPFPPSSPRSPDRVPLAADRKGRCEGRAQGRGRLCGVCGAQGQVSPGQHCLPTSAWPADWRSCSLAGLRGAHGQECGGPQGSGRNAQGL